MHALTSNAFVINAAVMMTSAAVLAQRKVCTWLAKCEWSQVQSFPVRSQSVSAPVASQFAACCALASACHVHGQGQHIGSRLGLGTAGPEQGRLLRHCCWPAAGLGCQCLPCMLESLYCLIPLLTGLLCCVQTLLQLCRRLLLVSLEGLHCRIHLVNNFVGQTCLL